MVTLRIRKITHHIKNIRRRLFTNVHNKHWLVVRDESLKEVFSIRLSPFNVSVGGGIVLFLIVSITILLIAFTPLKQLIPGYTRHDFVAVSFKNSARIDSLSNVVEAQGLMLQVMKDVIDGKIPVDVAIAIKDTLQDYSKIAYWISLQDSLLREKIERDIINATDDMTTDTAKSAKMIMPTI